MYNLIEGEATIGVGNKFAKDELSEKAQEKVAEVLGEFFGETIKVRFDVLSGDLASE